MVALSFFGKARAPVVVTINGYAYRTTPSVYGGKYYVPVRKEHRDAVKVAAGNKVAVTMKSDDEPRVVAVPPDLAKALRAGAKGAWDKLSYTHKREHVDAISSAKKPETRVRRVAKCIEMLKAR